MSCSNHGIMNTEVAIVPLFNANIVYIVPNYHNEYVKLIETEKKVVPFSQFGKRKTKGKTARW